MSSLNYHDIIQKLKVPERRTFLKLLIFSFSLLVLLLCSTVPSFGVEITGPVVALRKDEIYVTTALSLDDNILQELRNGITKEFRFNIDLFRVWRLWPDEFILNKFFIRTLRCDPVKMEYVAKSDDGSTLIKKRFKSFESMLQWALSVNDLKLAGTRDLDPGSYYVKVTVESRIRKLPPVIGYFMIFLPENEFKISKNSRFIHVGNR
jgi:hypothetical protein